MLKYSSATLVEAEKLWRFNDEGVNDTLLAGPGGGIEVAEVFGSGIRKGGIGVTRRRVENGRINVVQQWVWGREELT
jgi:hypothetical protein